MEIYIETIEEVDLPNYIETIWSGDKVKEVREAPLLAKYRVDLQTSDRRVELFYEVRDQSRSGPLIDEYYDEQVFNALMSLLTSIVKEKEKFRAYNRLNSQITTAIHETFNGKVLSYPIPLSVND